MGILDRLRRAGIRAERVTVPPDLSAADVVALGTSCEAQLAELRSRFDEAARLLRTVLDAQGDLDAEDRNDELVDLALDVRAVLARSSVPVSPGRSS